MDDPNESHRSLTERSGTMDFAERFGCERWPLHYACRVGNLENVQYLVDHLHCSIDEADAHDATPLYLAALTGQVEICRFLLERGAKCNENDGDAARVFYVALTPELRRLLREWSLTAASRDAFLDSIRKSFNDATYADVSVALHSRKSLKRRLVYLHRILLHARCPRLADMATSAEQQEHKSDSCFSGENTIKYHINLNDRYHDDVAIHVLNYLYTGAFDLTKGIDFALESRQMASELNIDRLVDSIDSAVIHTINSSKDATQSNQHRKSDDRIENIDHSNELRNDMKQLASWVSTPYSEFESLSDLNLLLDYTDVTIECLESSWSVNRFRLCEQSEYFQRGFLGGFREAHESTFNVSHLLPSPEAWKYTIQWMYADQFVQEHDAFESTSDDEPSVSLATAVEILEVGFAILCPRLSAYVTNTVLIPAVDTENVFEMISLARMYDKLDRLEDKCVEVIGIHFEELKDSTALRSLLATEAAGIVQGGDIRVMDVPICAEICRAIAKHNSGDSNSDLRSFHIHHLQNLVREVAMENNL
ncbi:hypothetical protein ACA910_007752 [Epithemia clementina (nom. ined.)]